MSSPCTDLLAHIDLFVDTPTLVNAATTCKAWERRTRAELARRAAKKIVDDQETYRRVAFFSLKWDQETNIEGQHIPIRVRFIHDPTNFDIQELVCYANVPGCFNSIDLPCGEDYLGTQELADEWDDIVDNAVRQQGLYLYEFFGPLPHGRIVSEQTTFRAGRRGRLSLEPGARRSAPWKHFISSLQNKKRVRKDVVVISMFSYKTQIKSTL